MPGDLNDISVAIGGLQANTDNILLQLAEIGEKVDTLQANNTENGGRITAAHTSLAKLAPMVEAHEGLKNKVVGIVAAVGVIFGLLGAVLGKVFHI